MYYYITILLIQIRSAKHCRKVKDRNWSWTLKGKQINLLGQNNICYHMFSAENNVNNKTKLYIPSTIKTSLCSGKRKEFFEPIFTENLKFSLFYVNQLLSADCIMYRNFNVVFVLSIKLWRKKNTLKIRIL